jgi:hypothetical protein
MEDGQIKENKKGDEIIQRMAWPAPCPKQGNREQCTLELQACIHASSIRSECGCDDRHRRHDHILPTSEDADDHHPHDPHRVFVCCCCSLLWIWVTVVVWKQ